MLFTALWCYMWGRGQIGSNGACSTLCWFSVSPSATHTPIGPFWCCLSSGWVCVCFGPCGSLQGTLLWGWEFPPLQPQPPQVFSVSGLRLYFPMLEPWVPWSVTWSTSCCLASQLQLCQPCSTMRHLAGSASCHLAESRLCPAALLRPSCRSGWMFLLKLLGCRTSYNLIFCQFWLFFVFKLLLSFFWLCEEAQCVYLRLHLGQKSNILISMMVNKTFENLNAYL